MNDILSTELQNESSKNIDLMSTKEILQTINNQDKLIAHAIEKALKDIEQLIDQAYLCLKNKGRIIYIGAGTSGRLGILDASECPPTYGVDENVVKAIIAGGKDAMFKSKENVEDDEQAAINDLKAINLSKKDMVIGIAASGKTPYVIQALKYANSINAQTGSISCVQNARISVIAKYKVEIVTGAEIISGSTRMKAGTATKMVLNMISTTCMIKLGKVYDNLMIDVKPSNKKLIERGKNIIMNVAGCDYETAHKYFLKSNHDVKLAIIMILTKSDLSTAKKLLLENEENGSKTIRQIKCK